MHSIMKKQPGESVMNDAASGRNNGEVPVASDAKADSSGDSLIARPVAYTSRTKPMETGIIAARRTGNEKPSALIHGIAQNDWNSRMGLPHPLYCIFPVCASFMATRA